MRLRRSRQDAAAEVERHSRGVAVARTSDLANLVHEHLSSGVHFPEHVDRAVREIELDSSVSLSPPRASRRATYGTGRNPYATKTRSQRASSLVCLLFLIGSGPAGHRLGRVSTDRLLDGQHLQEKARVIFARIGQAEHVSQCGSNIFRTTFGVIETRLDFFTHEDDWNMAIVIMCGPVACSTDLRVDIYVLLDQNVQVRAPGLEECILKQPHLRIG